MITNVGVPPFNAPNDLSFNLQFLLHLLHLEPILCCRQSLCLAQLLTKLSCFPAVFAVPLNPGSGAGVLLKDRILRQTFFIFTSRPGDNSMTVSTGSLCKGGEGRGGGSKGCQIISWGRLFISSCKCIWDWFDSDRKYTERRAGGGALYLQRHQVGPHQHAQHILRAGFYFHTLPSFLPLSPSPSHPTRDQS